jgi:hypothetical protein
MRTLIENLPAQTQFNRIVPKDMFDKFTSTHQKKLFVEVVERIRWTHKLFDKSTNLLSKEVKEIEIFQIDLRRKNGIEELTTLMDKAIPYPILFVLNFENNRKWMISKKHPNPTNENISVIDWTFESEWLTDKDSIGISLKVSLDEVFKDLCFQLTPDKINSAISVNDLINNQRATLEISKKIENLKSKLANEKQFNRKVEFNLALEKLESELSGLQGK